MSITRRGFITRVAQVGGFGAAFMTLHSLGLMGMAETEQEKGFRCRQRRAVEPGW